jgi:hypothetical protein
MSTENKITKLKKLNAAYIASLEYDYCPDSDEAEEVAKLFDVAMSIQGLQEALEEHQGCRPDELARQMSDLIKEL